MASKLNPGADATLVGVAYRAAMADTPGDYSDTLEKAAESYGKTMEASGEMWGNIAKVGAAIGGEMMKNAQELTDAVAKGATLNPTDARMFYDEIYGIKDELNALGTFNGQFGDRETRQKRAELKIKQKELFADIDNAVANLKVGADAIAAGTFDDDLAGLKDKEKINAIIKSNLKNNITENGNTAKLSRDENGELIYTLYDSETGLPTMEDGEPQTMTLKQFNESIATNVKDGGAMKTAFGSFTEQESNAGNKALNGTYDPERKQMTLNKLDTLLGDKPVNLKRAMRTPIGYSNTSFYDDITKEQGEHSVGLYNTLLEATGGDVLTGDITDGMVDTDGVEGISRQEAMNAENYKILTANIVGLKDPEASKAYFKEYAVKEMEKAYKYGYSKKPPVPGETNVASDKLDFYSKGNKVQLLNNQYLSGGSAQSLYNDIESGNSFDAKDPLTGNINNYSFKVIGDEGGWYENFEKDDTPESVQFIGSGYDLSKKFTNDSRYKNIQTTVEQEVNLKTGLTSFDNPFGDGTDKIANLPSDFTKAVGKDDLKVKEYLDNMDIKGLEVKASGFGSDSVTLNLGGKSKTFIVDTNFTDDEDRASEIWKWLHTNWSASGSNYSGSAADIVAGI